MPSEKLAEIEGALRAIQSLAGETGPSAVAEAGVLLGVPDFARLIPDDLAVADAVASRDDLDADPEGLGGEDLLSRELGASMIEEIKHP